MASLTIRNVPDAVMNKLRKTAAERNRSMNAQAVEWLDDSARRHISDADWDGLLERIRLGREEMRRRHGRGTDSTGLIRKMREERTAHLMRVAEGGRGKTNRQRAR